jgi:predicted DNA-binding protein
MSTKNPRVNVTFDGEQYEIIHFLSQKKHLSMSSLIKKIVEDWLEDYEDIMILKKLEERENDQLIEHDKFWEDLI